MFKLTETTEGNSKSHHFTDDCVILGDGADSKAHFPLPGRGLKSEHVKIFKQNGSIFVQNLTNDPFITLNGDPFFKKKVLPGDILKIRDCEIKIDELKEAEPHPPPASPVEKAAPVLQAPPEELHKTEEHKKEDVHAPEEVIAAPALPKERQIKRKSLKDFDAPLENDKTYSKHLNVSPFRHVKLFSFILVAFFMVLGVIALEIYLRTLEESNKEELVAAESLSDIAMALAYAQLYHISPHSHNWSDPDFIQNNLLATLPTGSQEGVCLSSEGSFNNCSYILRVYTSNDLSRFLLIAHPAPSLIQWLIPKSSILVDSSSMELRKLKDLKTLNRLLSTLNTLDGVNVYQIRDIVKQGEIISLEHLAKATKKTEFLPPKALKYLRPGAENLLYNAPRYHPFGDAILKKAINFSSLHTSSHELQMLQSELEVLKRLPNIVFYTAEGPAAIREAREGLKLIAPDAKYLMATFKYDNNWQIRSTQIVMEAELPKVQAPKEIPEPEPIAAIEEPAPPETAALEYEAPEFYNPALLALKKLKKDQTDQLEAAKDAAATALRSYLDSDSKLDYADLFSLMKQVQVLKKEWQVKIKDKILELIFEYHNVPLDDFMNYAEQSGLKAEADEVINPPKKNLPIKDKTPWDPLKHALKGIPER